MAGINTAFKQHEVNDELIIELTHLHIRVRQGDITKQNTDAIVNSSGPVIDAQTGLLGQAGKAIEKAGGPKLMKECRKLGKLNVLGVTGAGNMLCKKVFHLVTSCDTTRWPAMISAALQKAETLEFTSISFPALGTGRLGIPAPESAKAMFDAIVKYDTRYRPEDLQEINIVVFDAKMAEEYRSVLKKLSSSVTSRRMPMTSRSVRKPVLDEPKMWKQLGEALKRTQVKSEKEEGSMRPAAQETYAVELNNPMARAAVNNLGLEQLAELSELKVEVTIEEGTSGKFLRVHGHPLEVSSALSSIYEILYKAHSTALRNGNTHIEMPSHWQQLEDHSDENGIKLNPGSDEFETVKKRFTAGELKDADVRMIWRIQNAMIYEVYQFHKTTLQKRNAKDGEENEKILYHGTHFEVLEKISMRGFNRSYCGKNATQYGKGVYFAVRPHLAANRKYAVPDDNGYQYVYQCRVLTGRYTRGHHSYQEAPIQHNVMYNSTVDDVDNPSQFVIYTDNHAYPEYLIGFKQCGP